MNYRNVMDKMLTQFFTTDISNPQIAVILTAALLFGVYIFIIYRLAVKNEFYSKDFNRSVALMSVVTAGIILGLQSNLVISLGTVGALSIIRFRTAIKNTFDLIFLYWAISTGILCGASLFSIALILCVLTTIGIFALNFFEMPVMLKMLVIHCKDAEMAKEAYECVKKYSGFIRLKNKTVTRRSTELVIEFRSKRLDELENELGLSDKIEDYSLINYDRETRI